MSIRAEKSKGRRGFTLIEMLIVMVVLGILAAIAIPKLNVTKRRAYRSSMLSDLQNLANAQEIYANLYYTYSSDLSLLEAAESEGVTLDVNEATNSGWSATATHLGVTTEQCGIFYGDAAQTGGDPATVPGVVACSF